MIRGFLDSKDVNTMSSLMLTRLLLFNLLHLIKTFMEF